MIGSDNRNNHEKLREQECQCVQGSHNQGYPQDEIGWLRPRYSTWPANVT
jgi:hypothetical protein